MSYWKSSRNATLINGNSTLRAECQRLNGDWVVSEIDLNTCLANLNGYLAWGEQGLTNTADDIRLEENGRRLTCTARKMDGENRERQGVELEYIQNIDGQLRFVPPNSYPA